ncbi:MAG: hypothetical protein H7Y03_14695 [Chitinophagaceae bacterium]|nr:hypothetical protein [Chitinophagaceae bacterium]
MKLLLLFFLLLSVPVSSFTQDGRVEILLRKASGLELAKKSADALSTYQEVLRVDPKNMSVLCKCSELCSIVGNHQKERATRNKYFQAARKYAELALKVNPSWSEANLVMSLAMGRAALIASGKERIIAVEDIRSYALKAVSYDSTNYKAYHILGRWCYEVSNLGFFERTAAIILYGGVPKSTFLEAIRWYEKSISLAPNFPLNYLECAKAYEKYGQVKKAISLLQKMQLMPLITEDDAEIRKEGKALLEKLGS